MAATQQFGRNQDVSDRLFGHCGRIACDLCGNAGSDSSLVMRLPKEKIIFAVDTIPLQSLSFREMADNYIPDLEDSLKKTH